MRPLAMINLCAARTLQVLMAMALALGVESGALAEGVAAAPSSGDADIVHIDHSISPDFIKTAQPQSRQVPVQVPVNGKLGYDKRQLRIASARLAGRLGRIFVFEGQSVTAGQPLAEIYSPDYLSAEREFLLARRFRDTLAANTEAELAEDAESTAQASANKLKVLGASEDDIRRLGRTGVIEDYLKVRAPIPGVVIQRNVDPGAYLNIGDTLMSLASLDALWLTANIYETDFASLKVGQTLTFETDALPGQQFTSPVSFISPGFDPSTHTLGIRCDVANVRGRLRPEMPITGLLTTGMTEALALPQQAIVRVRDLTYVFVQKDDKTFQRVQVKGFPLVSSEFAVTQGLSLPVKVVIDGGVLLNQALGG